MTDTAGTYAPSLAFDPDTMPQAYDGVRTRRLMSFFIDAVLVVVWLVIAAVVIAIFGILTLGLGWLLYAIMWPVVAILYNMITVGGRHQGTPGMRMMGLKMYAWDGDRMHPVHAGIHAIGFWLSMSLTPLVLLVSLFNARKRLLHDMLLGTVVIRSDVAPR